MKIFLPDLWTLLQCSFRSFLLFLVPPRPSSFRSSFRITLRLPLPISRYVPTLSIPPSPALFSTSTHPHPRRPSFLCWHLFIQSDKSKLLSFAGEGVLGHPHPLNNQLEWNPPPAGGEGSRSAAGCARAAHSLFLPFPFLLVSIDIQCRLDRQGGISNVR